MAKIILKCPYLKPGSARHSENLVNYIAKRDGVQKIDDTWKAQSVTAEQKKLIDEIVRDFPDAKDSFEYTDYLAKPSKGTASEFISRAIEDNLGVIGKRENYIGYIAKRPRAERHGAHGLFTDSDVPVNLSKVAEEVANHKGNVWTNIISLRREDAERLGYDNAYAWRNLLRSQAMEFAKNMKVPISDLRWYAAYHDESHHPHVHMVVYSAGKEPYLSKDGILNIKSSLARQIFKHDLLQVYMEQTNQRNALTQKSRDVLSDIISRINSGSYDNPIVTELLLKLAELMKEYKGKKVYGYLPQAGRNIVNAVVDELAKDESISALYDLWYEQRETVIKTYQDAMPSRIPLSQNKEFKAIKNAVIQESLNNLYDRITFEEAVSEPEETAPEMPEPIAETDTFSIPKSKWNDPNSMFYQYRRAKEHLIKDSVQYNPAEAIRWLLLSANQGYEYAQYRLGKLYLTGDEAEQNLPQAELWFKKASEQNNSYAKYALAKMHLSGTAQMPDEKKAIRLLKESADSGNQWAQYLLGKFCFRGEHTEKNLPEAERLLSSAANQKNSQAQYLLAKLYLCNDGIPKDAAKAVHWLKEACAQHNQYAQYQLGKMLLYGQDTEKNIDEGIRLLSAAAEQGNIYAARMLQNYHTGRKPSVGMASFRLLSQLARMFQDRLRRDEDGQRMMTDKKLRQKIEEKKQAHGLKMG